MKLLITGSQGMLGRALTAAALANRHEVVGLDLEDAELCVDLTRDNEVTLALEEVKPDVVVNCAAIVDVGLCDRDPLLAWKVNARIVSVLAQTCQAQGAKFVQISTDHYFSGNGDRTHDEEAPVLFVNEYARTKFAGEGFATVCKNHLTLRTNIVGFRRHGSPTFAEWAFDAVEQDKEMTLFHDSYVSSIDVEAFSRALLDLVRKNASGLFNVANHEVISKERLIRTIAEKLGVELTRAGSGSVKKLGVRRADSCGLDVRKAESALGYELPTLDEVVDNLINQWKRI